MGIYIYIMGGGLMQLVAYGQQDIYLTGNPQITFFKVVYRRHTNFSVENISQITTGTSSFGGKATCQIQRNGDLITKMYIKTSLSSSVLETDPGKWGWVEKLGHALIQDCELEIGGTKIDKHYLDWL